jgi:hypothetical protein
MGTKTWKLTSGEVERTHPLYGVFMPEVVDRSEISQNQESSSGDISVYLPLTTEVAQEFVAYAPPEPIWLTIFAGHDGDSEILSRYRGKVAKAEFGDDCKLIVVSEKAAIRKKIPGPVYQKMCNRLLYSAGCGASETGNSWDIVVASVAADGVTITVNEALSPAYATYWGGHWLSSGDNQNEPRLSWGFALDADGHRMMIASHPDVDTFVLKARMVGLTTGSTLHVVRGCRRNVKHCNFFGRLDRFSGFDFFPSKNPFEGTL